MTRFLIPIAVLYILYYAGNIIWDLFIKKEKIVATDANEVYTLSDVSEEDSAVKAVGIADVEAINAPDSFTVKERISDINERPDIDSLREKFEAEIDLGDFSDYEKESRTSINEEANEETQVNIANEAEENNINFDKQKKKLFNNSQFKEFLNLSETMVQMVANHDGHKVYQSTIN